MPAQQRAKIRVVSTRGEPFRDRIQAGQLMAAEMGELKSKRAIILGIPRGGIIIAREMARVLDADLDIVLARKLGTPGQNELAMGALAEDGTYFLNQRVVDMAGVSSRAIDEEIDRQTEEIKRRSQLIRKVLPRTPLKDRIVVVTDDGAATGATMQAALWVATQEKPQKLIAAIPVGSEDALSRLSDYADEIICLRLPEDISAIGQYYYQFTQIEDAEVVQILAEEARKRKQRENKKD
jgi:putative phosphoribosyl transferase